MAIRELFLITTYTEKEISNLFPNTTIDMVIENVKQAYRRQGGLYLIHKCHTKEGKALLQIYEVHPIAEGV